MNLKSSHLSAEIMSEYELRLEAEKPVDDLMKLAMEMVPFFLTHNAEPDACDLLVELEALDKLPEFLDKNTYSRVALYLIRYGKGSFQGLTLSTADPPTTLTYITPYTDLHNTIH